MIAAPSPRGWVEPLCPAMSNGEPIIRFTVAPAQNGAWIWRTFQADGQPRTQGLASTRKQAAALVIRDIILARTQQVAPPIPEHSAKAA